MIRSKLMSQVQKLKNKIGSKLAYMEHAGQLGFDDDDWIGVFADMGADACEDYIDRIRCLENLDKISNSLITTVTIYFKYKKIQKEFDNNSLLN